MSEERVREYAKEKGFHPQTLARWLSWGGNDRDALYRFAATLKIGENHLRDLMDWLEEIALREHRSIQEILAEKSIAHIETNPRLGRADKLKRIKEEIRRLRFPRLSRIEDTIRAGIRELRLDPRIRISVPAGLEGGSLRVEFSAAAARDLKKLASELVEAADKGAVRDIFGLLAGEAAQETGGPTV